MNPTFRRLAECICEVLNISDRFSVHFGQNGRGERFVAQRAWGFEDIAEENQLFPALFFVRFGVGVGVDELERSPIRPVFAPTSSEISLQVVS